jgi:tRNA (guanine-N7-)-methyltransferase
MAELRKRHGAHARALKNLEERYEWYARSIELEAEKRKGAWVEHYYPQARELHLDLGCGKGQFAIAQAQLHPDVLFVGLDYDRRCIALAAQKACELGLENCVFALADAEDLGAFFADAELSRIYLNFSTPHPRKKHASERLTYVDQLIAYRPLLTENGTIDMKTDSPPFFEFSLIQFDLAGYDIAWSSTDLRAERPDEPLTEYEQRLCDKGAKVHACRAIKTSRPYTREQTAMLSLFEYLPEDLDALTYIPYGMEGHVLNMRNKHAKENARLIQN